MIKTIPQSATFGQELKWQYDSEFIEDVKRKIEERNDNEFQIYEEQIEDVIRALASMGSVVIGA